MAPFGFCGVLARGESGPVHAIAERLGAVRLLHDPADDLLRPGSALLIEGTTWTRRDRFSYRGPVMHQGDGLGLAITDEAGTLLMLAADDPGDAAITIGPRREAICGFLAGTLIQTPSGARPIETLQPGDLVDTDAVPAPVLRLTRRLACALITDPLLALPIRLRAGTLGSGVPSYDLLLSPDHAMLIGGRLIQVGALVNGASVTRDDAHATTTYLQLHLAQDSIIFANDTPVETSVSPPAAAEPDEDNDATETQPPAPPSFDYPRATSHRQVPAAIHTGLAGWAG